MNIQSHYYAVLALCRILGYNKDASRIIAYSSEYVDEALVRRISSSRYDFKMTKLDTVGPIMTDRTYSERDLVKTLVPFHFVPALKGKDLQEKMRTFPNSPFLRIMQKQLFKQKNPYLLGIYLHVYADTWSHQGFSGIMSPVNIISDLQVKYRSFKGFGNRIAAFYMAKMREPFHRMYHPIIPNYSHSQVGTLPDLTSAEWKYTYGEGSENSGWIDNKKRFKAAFLKMEELLQDFLKENPQFGKYQSHDDQRREFYSILASNSGKRKEIQSWRKFMMDYAYYDKKSEIPKYDPSEWLRTAFPELGRNDYKQYHLKYSGKPNEKRIRHSDWFYFVTAVKDYKKRYISWMGENGLEMC